MTYDFEGKTEKEAIDKAASELGLERDRFDVEILEVQKGGFFHRGSVKIRVHTDDVEMQPEDEEEDAVFERDVEATLRPLSRRPERPLGGSPEPQPGFEQEVAAYIEGVTARTGCPSRVSVLFREPGKLGLRLDSPDSAILIGRKGKTLDALQLLASIYGSALTKTAGEEEMRIVLDSEGYRQRREESLVRLAYNVADRVRASRGSLLLEPMNPYDRRIIHTALNDIVDVETHSEGEGLYKQVRVYYKR